VLGEAVNKPLFQERLRNRPFWMLVRCILANRTSGAQAAPALNKLMAGWGTAGRIAGAPVERIERIIRPCDLSQARARSIIALAKEWGRHGAGWHRRHFRRADVLGLPGCGRYASDSWAIFIEGDSEVRPTDRKLQAFLKGAKA
jgi:methyl-CpG-binding domain protein 4